MKITLTELRGIIRSVLKESHENDSVSLVGAALDTLRGGDWKDDKRTLDALHRKLQRSFAPTGSEKMPHGDVENKWFAIDMIYQHLKDVAQLRGLDHTPENFDYENQAIDAAMKLASNLMKESDPPDIVTIRDDEFKIRKPRLRAR